MGRRRPPFRRRGLRATLRNSLGPRVETCPACGAPEHYWASKNGHRLARCRAVAPSSPAQRREPIRSRVTTGIITKQLDFQVAQVVQRSLDALVASASRYRQVGRWLDFGFGEGALLRSVGETRLESPRCRGLAASARLRPCAGMGRCRAPRRSRSLPGERIRRRHAHRSHRASGGPRPRAEAGHGVATSRGLVYLTTPNVHSLNGRLLGPAGASSVPLST